MLVQERARERQSKESRCRARVSRGRGAGRMCTGPEAAARGLVLLLMGLVGLAAAGPWSPGQHHQQRDGAKCEPLNVSFCRGLRYNLTAMPNFMGHDDQLQAERALTTLMPLVHYNCSRHLRFFLCSVFAPVCSEHVAMQIPACKPLCLSVRRDCDNTLRELTLPWPHMLDCDRFPDQGNTLCVQPPPEEGGAPDAPSTEPSGSSSTELVEQRHQDVDGQQEGEAADGQEEEEEEEEKQVWQPVQLSPVHRKCPERFVETPYVDVVSVPYSHIRAFMLVTTCVPKCGEDAFYRAEDKRFAERWMIGWAWLCFLSTLFSLLTFWVDQTRFRYPERPIVFLALCHNLLALAYIARGAIGPDTLSCATQDDGPSYVPVNDGLRSLGCTMWWIARYYLSLASSFWWMILCGSWLLSARNEWSSEALHNVAGYLHGVAWGVPVLFTAGGLISRAVSADELTGVCQTKDESALWLEVMPNAGLVATGCLLGSLAGAALVRVRRAVRLLGRSATKLERLMTRLGVFAVLYALPALGGLACVAHEARLRPEWRRLGLLAAIDCRPGEPCAAGPSPEAAAAALQPALLRLFLQLLIGIASGMWVWSGKTCRAWSRLLAAPTKPPRPPLAAHRLPQTQPFPAYTHNVVNVA